MNASRSWTRPRSASLRIAGASSNSRAGTMAAIRPPFGQAVEGGVQVGLQRLERRIDHGDVEACPRSGRRSFRCTASCWERGASGNRPSSSAARPGADLVQGTPDPPQASASTARRPVPAEGSSTRSPVAHLGGQDRQGAELAAGWRTGPAPAAPRTVASGSGSGPRGWPGARRSPPARLRAARSAAPGVAAAAPGPPRWRHRRRATARRPPCPIPRRSWS